MDPASITRDSDGKHIGVLTGMGIKPSGVKRAYNKTGKYRKLQSSSVESAIRAQGVRSAAALIKRRHALGQLHVSTNEDWKYSGGRWKRHMEKEFVSPFKKQVVTKRITEFFGYVDNTQLEQPIKTDVIDLTESKPRSPIGAENPEDLELTALSQTDTIVNISD